MPPSLAELLSANAENDLVALWRKQAENDCAWNLDAYKQLGIYFRAKDPLLAYEVFREGLEKYPCSNVLAYQQALTLARLGFHKRAMEMALRLASEKIDDEEMSTDIASFIARLHKDRGLTASDPQERRRHLEAAFASYQQAFQRAAPGYKSYPGINAATLGTVIGKFDVAQELALEARRHAAAELAQADDRDYWRVATIAEAEFVLGNMDGAARAYGRAVDLAGRCFDDISSMRRNARLLAQHFGGRADWVEEVLRLPAVVVFTGHMIDRPGRTRPRFPENLESSVGKAIEDRLRGLNAGFGFSGAACGSDILFIEAMLKRGHTHIMLPFGADQFRKTSVDFPAQGNWSARFDAVLAGATKVENASGAPAEWGGIVFEYANLLLLGLATLKSRSLDTELIGLAVWDGRPGDGSGGTASTIDVWRKQGLCVEEIAVGDFSRAEHAT